MQDRYVGDIGDFGKFALLRALARGSSSSFRLGVAWCRFPDESHNGDGRHVAYLARPDFAALAPSLHAALGELVESGQRSLGSIERAKILPSDTIYFGEATASAAGSRPRMRLVHRDSWLKRALQVLEPSDLVFFDPDNGVEAPSVPRYHPKAGKYVYWEELLPFWQRGQSLVIYHHLNRTASATAQGKALRERFVEKLGEIPCFIPLLFRRGSCRFFFILAQKAHAHALQSASERFVKQGWHQHFEHMGD